MVDCFHGISFVKSDFVQSVQSVARRVSREDRGYHGACMTESVSKLRTGPKVPGMARHERPVD